MISRVLDIRLRQLAMRAATRVALATFLLAPLLPSAKAHAQATTGSVRGFITISATEPAAGATVSARNIASGQTRTGLANDRGYYILLGLVAGEYEITVRRIGAVAATRRQTVQIGQSLTLDISLAAAATTLAQVQVSATAAAETRTSEVATNVSAAQIENLPTSDRNFLTFAQLAPGVRISGSGTEATSKSFSAGAQPAQNVNIFIDGASLKSDVLPSGLSGQDASRGNPFPQNAVQEFRVITQNYKAEYQKATSAIITATTKSGSNNWEGNFFGYGQGTNFTALDTFALNRKGAPNSNFVRPTLTRYLAGGSIGGPIVQDKLFMFASYETNIQDRANTVSFTNLPALLPDSVKSQFYAQAGTFVSPFRSNLVFGKLTYLQSDKTSYEASYSLRHETDIRNFGGQTSFQNAENIRNDVNNVVVKRTYASGQSLHETLLNFSRANWNPSPENNELVGRNYFGAGLLGGNSTIQKFVQDRLSLRHDFTYTGFNAGGEHTIKVGGNLDALKYDVSKFFNGNPTFKFRQEDNYAFPFEASYGKGDPNITRNNGQVGVYVQDDYSPIPRLTFNAGIRWDYESNQFDNGYVTPAKVVSESAPFNVPARYISTGKERKPFLGAFQPRLGMSFALDQAQRTTLFAGAGLFYDRSNFNNGFDERYRLQFQEGTFRFSTNGLPRDGQPTVIWQPKYLTKAGLDELIAQGTTGKPEAFLIDNETRPPSAVHYNAGIRQLLGSWQFSLTYMGAQSKNGFTYIFGSRNAQGGCCASLPSFGALLLSSNGPKTWYSAAAIQANRPYQFAGRDKFNWGVGLTYTVQKAERIGGDLFSLDYRTVEDYPRTPSANDIPVTIVGNWILDIPFLGGLQWSGLMNISSGERFTIDDQSAGGGIDQRKLRLSAGRTPTESFLGIKAFGFRNVDMRLRKDIPFANSRIGIVGDFYNVFNFQNLGCFNGFIAPTTGAPNANYGKAGCTVSDSRRAQIGLTYDFR
ncbi:MAG: TonB-dependent receptor [Phycisphaerae bacterium]|nr:TonB-dependent receptor [Gemmatimonadaceae bacterium]